MITDCVITCPHCGHAAADQMPPAPCRIDYVCPGCSKRVEPPAGECCVYCAYGSVICPFRQQMRHCCQGD